MPELLWNLHHIRWNIESEVPFSPSIYPGTFQQYPQTSNDLSSRRNLARLSALSWGCGGRRKPRPAVISAAGHESRRQETNVKRGRTPSGRMPGSKGEKTFQVQIDKEKNP
jgi:hypothetical protein